MKKKLTALLLVLTIVCSMSICASAKSYSSEDMEYYTEQLTKLTTKTEIELNKNDIHDTYRHIKLYWTKLKGVNGYQLQLSTDPKFRENVISSIVTPKHQLPKQYSSKSITKNIDSTYYIRIRGVFDYKYNDRYIRIYGVWSDVVIAEGNEE